MSPLTTAENGRAHDIQALADQVRRLDQEIGAYAQRRVASSFLKDVRLLLVGFLLTGVAGSWLTYFWKKNESANERKALALRADLDARRALMQDVGRAVAAAHTSASDVLSLYYFEPLPKAEINEVRAFYWSESRKWRTESKVLQLRLAVYFRDPAISAQFKQVIDKRKELGNVVKRLLTGSITRKADVEVAKTGGLALANELESLLLKCGRRMGAETAQLTDDAAVNEGEPK